MKGLRLVAPVTGLALLAIFVALWCWDRDLYFRGLGLLGVPAWPFPFLDWDAISSAIACARRGVDVFHVDPCDVLGRAWNYSPLWLEARFIPAGPLWRNAIGLAMDAGFFASLYFVFKPATWRETALFTVTCISPTVAYGVERANIDLLIYMMLVAAGVLLQGGARRRFGGYALLLLAGLLKFYPLAALAIALRERARLFWIIIAVCALVVLGFGWVYWREIPLTLTNVPHGEGGYADAFGASNFPGLFAKALATSILVLFIALAAAGALLIAFQPGLAEALAAGDPRERTLLLLGAAVIVGCFFSGLSVVYRGVFLILVEAGLLDMRRRAAAAPRRRLTQLAALVAALTWADGLGRLLPWLLPAREVVWWVVVAGLVGLLFRFAWDSEAARRIPRQV